jgi:SAM-dependent methyltransferase
VGSVLISDQTQAMLAGARERAGKLGLSNLEFQVLNAEWIDLPLASVDVVLCRWGYMLMADVGAALAETRRVLRPGGRVALAVWDAIEHNPWASLPAQALAAHGHGAASGADGRPGPFALGSRERLAETLAGAGFAVSHIETVELVHRHESFQALWDFQLDVSPSFHNAVMSLTEPQIAAVRASLGELVAPFTDAGGALEIGGRTLLARAEA